MRLQQTLRKTLLHARSRHTRLLTAVQQALQHADDRAAPLSLAAALASKELVRHLWDALPAEASAYRYASIEQLTTDGRWCVAHALDERVTLHLGWDVIGFTTSVQAAWEMWPSFATLNTDTYNVCVYPESLGWYIIRAGTRLYPIDCTQDGAVLMRPPGE